MKTTEPILGSLLGTAVGDALGLPYEGMSRQRVRAFGEVRHRLFAGRGMLSDDTEHALMLAAALQVHSDDVDAFQRAFAWNLRWWLLALPAGVGLEHCQGDPATMARLSAVQVWRVLRW
jgi:ADP-ribosyl-[dinitrogen reductase] hydrolase